ncbi:hypothetical protein BD414DRAFT_536916 [Trametes punicea]|nr:hypothetical protein BD414DRAFT_536916 [Trametes punicea]
MEELPPPRDIMHGVLVPPLQRLTPPEVTLQDKPISVEGFRCVGSYTWRDLRNPTIDVPGSPRQWRGDLALPLKVPFDRGVHILNEDGYRMGSASPLLPLFRAVDLLASGGDEGPVPSPENAEALEPVDWASIDVVTDRNNLRKLIRWIREPYPDPTSPPISSSSSNIHENADTDQASASGTEPEWDPRKDFRIDLHLGGEKTVLMQRWAMFDRERVAPPKGGCRDNFIREVTTTAPGCENGGGHFRIVQYDLDGLKMIVRWEVDACVLSTTDVPPLSVTTTSDSDSILTPVEPAPPLAVDINELARWDTTDTGSGAAWGVPDVPAAPPTLSIQPAKTGNQRSNANPSATVDIDRLALWEDNIEEAGAWDTSAPVAPAPATAAARPIEQGNTIDLTDLNAAIAVWDSPIEDPAAAAAAWGDPVPQKARNDVVTDHATMWDTPTNTDGAAWGVDLRTGDTFTPIPDLTIVRAGTLLPQSSILELATRSANFIDRTSVEDTYIQLFLTQTPTNLLAVHKSGLFDRVIRQELDSPELAKFGEDAGMQHSLKQLVALLREIQEMVKQHGKGGRLSLVCQKGKHEVYSRAGEEDASLSSELARFTAA